MTTQTKQYKYLKKLVGKEIIRIKPCECTYGTDNSHTGGKPVRLVSISKKEIVYEVGRIVCKEDAEWMAEWLDGNWYSVEDAMRFPKTKLNKLQGKMIHSKSNQFSSGHIDNGFVDKPVKLIVATKYHLLVDWNGQKWWLNNRFTNPNDWQEA